MRAVVVERFGGPEVLTLVEQEQPVPGPGQVLIRVLYTSVNFADIKARHGQYHGGGAPPYVPGLDVMGTVAALGAGVAGFSVGQRVIAFPATGSYAEFVLADAALVFQVPDEVAADQAAACPVVGLTSDKLLADVARVQPGEAVLVHAAAGGVGTTALQLARVLGAGLVVGAVGSAGKEPAARAAGADVVVNTREADWPDRVSEATAGRGVDVILDSVAGRVTGESFRCLAPFGRLVNFGDASGEAGWVPTIDLHGSCRAVLGFSLGTTRRHRAQDLSAAAAAVLSFLAHNLLTMHVGREMPLEQAGEAQRLVEERASTGKVLLAVSE